MSAPKKKYMSYLTTNVEFCQHPLSYRYKSKKSSEHSEDFYALDYVLVLENLTEIKDLENYTCYDVNLNDSSYDAEKCTEKSADNSADKT